VANLLRARADEVAAFAADAEVAFLEELG